MEQNFVSTADPEMVAKLLALGFTIYSQQNGVTTFINDVTIPHEFAKSDVVYSNLVSV